MGLLTARSTKSRAVYWVVVLINVVAVFNFVWATYCMRSRLLNSTEPAKFADILTPLKLSNTTEPIPNDGFQNLLHWLRFQCGAEIAPVEVDVFDGIRGIKGKSSFLTGDLVANIPSQCILKGLDVDVGNLERFVQTPHERLIIFVALQRRLYRLGKESFWAPYIAMLPTLDEYKLILLTTKLASIAEAGTDSNGRDASLPSDLLSYHGLPILDSALTDVAELGKLFVKLRAAAPGVELLAWDDLVWGDAVVKSRACTVDDGPALVPFFDLHNTCATPDGGGGQQTLVWHQRLENGNFMMRAALGIAAGEQLTTRYFFQVDETRALLHYGFRTGAPNWRGLDAPPDPQCRTWLAAASNEGESSPPVVRNVAAIAEEYCAGAWKVWWSKVIARLSTYKVWINAFLHGDFRHIKDGVNGLFH